MRRALDIPLLASVLCAAVLIVVAGVGSSAWVDRSFPGFLLLDNRVVAGSLAVDWPALRTANAGQHELVSVEGVPLRSAVQLQRYVELLPVGTELRYGLRRGERSMEVTISTRRFSIADFMRVFALPLLCGSLLLALAVASRWLGGGGRIGEGGLLGFFLIGSWALSIGDLYVPSTLLRVHVGLECFLAAATLHVAASLPRASSHAMRRPGWVALPYAAGGVLAIVAQVGLYSPSVYAVTHRIAMGAFVAAGVLSLGSLAWGRWRVSGWRLVLRGAEPIFRP